jgi:cytochrome c oxidase subunit 2
VPFLIVIGMALPATRTVVGMKDTSNADITIKVTGMQWKWGYDYLKGEGEGISFLSNLSTPRAQVGAPGFEPTEKRGDNYLMEVDNEVVVPVHKKIRMVTTANDVIHSWSIPAFGVKQDAIPGFVRDTWFKAEHTAPSAATARSCAARSTPSCRSWCAWSPMPSTRPGSTARKRNGRTG